MNTLATTGESQLSIAEPSIGGMLQAMIASGVTTENTAALEKMMDLYERMDKRNAEKQFAAAFVALQSDMPGIHPTRAVPGNDGGTRYRFAPYEEIMRSVQPLLAKHGFTVTFDTRFAEGRITSVCTLMHAGGHSRSNEFACRIGSGPPKASEAQADGAAQTYSKRFALCNALNIVVEHDDDARTVGKSIDPAKAIELEDRCVAAKINRRAILQLAGAKSFAEIGDAKLAEVEKVIAGKERDRAAAQPDMKEDAKW